jgi:hypothetical protein
MGEGFRETLLGNSPAFERFEQCSLPSVQVYIQVHLPLVTEGLSWDWGRDSELYALDVRSRMVLQRNKAIAGDGAISPKLVAKSLLCSQTTCVKVRTQAGSRFLMVGDTVYVHGGC